MSRPRPTAGLSDLVMAQARQMPDAVAIRSAHRAVTYGALRNSALRWAAVLRSHGVGPETIVAVCGARSPELVGAMLGVLHAGGAYLPIDASYPLARKRQMITDARVAIAVTADREIDDEWGREITCVSLTEAPAPSATIEDVVSTVEPDDAAVVIYTSGSAGRPKAVVLSHRALLARFSQRRMRPRQLSCQKASISVVAHVSDLWLPLVCGATAVMLDDADVVDAIRLARALEQYGVPLLMAVPSHLRAVIDSEPAIHALRGIRQVALSGEAVTPSLAAAVLAKLPSASVLNGYGLTETTGMVTRAFIDRHTSVSIGTSLPGVNVYIADHHLRRTPVGVVGEICVAGDQIARGYLGRPAVTAERFVPHPSGHPGERLFRTGDRARYEADGRIIWQGRADDEVKIRGFRVSLHEVELAIEACGSVGHVAVVPTGTPSEGHRLTAYVVPSHGAGRLDSSDLRQTLRAVLPGYMVPSGIEIVSGLPLLPNGKVDRVALAGGAAVPEAPREGARIGVDDSAAEPEAALARMIADVLGLRMRPDATLIEHGADSLAAMRPSARIAERFGSQLAVSDLMQATLSEVARRIATMAGSSPGTGLTAQAT